jgi:hypothetical protein
MAVNPTGPASGTETGAGSLLARTRGWWRSPLLLPLVVFLVSLAVALRAALSQTDGRLIYALDDTYIHMAVAKTLAMHGIWGCTPFHFSSSSSSLLWTFLLGAVYRAFGVHDAIPLVLNVAFGIGTLAVAERSLRRIGVPPLLRASALLGIVLAFPLTAMVLMGMEHILHFLLTIAFAGLAVEVLTSPGEDARLSRRRTVALCALGALLGASRYEGFFLVGLACLALLLRHQLARAAAVLVASLLPVTVFGVISVVKGWYFLPNPLMVKAVGESASTLTALLKPFGSEDLAFLQNDRAMPILLGLAALAALAQGLARRATWRPAFLFPLLLLVMILLHGHFVFSPLYWAYRYDAYLVGFGLFVAAVVLVELPAPRGLARGVLPALVVIALVPLLADVREGLLADAEIKGMRHTYLEQYQTARFIQSYYPSATVIVNDLGAVTYYTGARILDVVGLGDIEPVRIMRRSAYSRSEVEEWAAPYRPSIAILSLGWSMIVPRIPHAREWRSATDRWLGRTDTGSGCGGREEWRRSSPSARSLPWSPTGRSRAAPGADHATGSPSGRRSCSDGWCSGSRACPARRT